MATTGFSFCGPTFATRDGLWTGERCVNWFPSIDSSENAKSKVSLQACPGLTTFLDVPASSAPVRGLWNGDNRLFTVTGGELFEISSAGAPTKRGDVFNALTPVQFAASGTSLLVATGNQIWRDSGTAVAKVLEGAISVVFLDGYYAALLDGSFDTDDANFIQLSDLGQDGVTWDPLLKQKINGPVDRGTLLIVHEGHLWIFCSRSIHVWYNSGNADYPFAPIQGTDIDIGTDYPWTIERIDMHLYFLGFDRRGQGRVYRTEGYTPVRISTESIEYLIDSYLRLGEDHLITGYGYVEDRHTFYVLSFPKAGACLVYDTSTNLWHERARWTGSAWAQWRGASYHAFVFGRHFVARGFAGPYPDADARRIYVQDIVTPADDGLPIRRLRAAPYVQAQQQWVFHHCLRLHTDAQAQLAMRYRKDDLAWSAVRSVAPVKQEAQYWRLGRDRNRLYEVSVIDDDHRPTVTEAWVNASPGIGR
jgi:hypothetical protein